MLNHVKLHNKTFRILLPVIYVIITLLFIGGIIVTIAEGPNPFGILFYPAIYPGIYLLDVLPKWLLPLRTNDWLLILVGALVNLVIYFLLGYLIDFIISRFRA